MLYKHSALCATNPSVQEAGMMRNRFGNETKDENYRDKQPEWQVKQERKRLKAEKNKKHPRKREAQTWVVVDPSQIQSEGGRSA